MWRLVSCYHLCLYLFITYCILCGGIVHLYTMFTFTQKMTTVSYAFIVSYVVWVYCYAAWINHYAIFKLNCQLLPLFAYTLHILGPSLLLLLILPIRNTTTQLKHHLLMMYGKIQYSRWGLLSNTALSFALCYIYHLTPPHVLYFHTSLVMVL